MKKILATDNSLRIISVIIAIVIWVYITIVMDPAVEVTVRDLPIQFIGQETLNSKGLAVISESATSVTVNVKGSRKKMGNNDMKTIIAKADVSTVSGEGVSVVPIEIVVPFENQGITNQSLYSVDVKIEGFVEREMHIDVNTSGTLAQSYMSGDIKVEPDTVTVRGPESAVGRLSKAAVDLNYGGADVDIDVSLPVEFYGEGGKELSALDAIMKRVSVSVQTASVHCPVLKIREIHPTVEFGRQMLPEDFSYKTEPSVLYVYGDDPGFAQVTEIRTEEVPLGKLLESEKVKVKLIIPDGVKILYDISEIEVAVSRD